MSARTDDLRVSVVVPCYGLRAGALAEAVASIREEGSDLEVIVVDDGSPGVAVAEHFASSQTIKFVRRTENGGVAAAQNSGIDAATGSHVCFLHSDDRYVSGRLEHQLRLASAQPDAIIGGKCRYDDGIATDPMPEATMHDLLRHSFGVHISPYLFPAHVLATERFDERLRGWEDWDLLLRLKLGRHEFLSSDRVVASVSADATDRLSDSAVNGIALAYLYDKYRPLMTSRSTRARWEFKVGRNMRRAGDRAAAKRWLLRSLKTEPWHPRRLQALLYEASRT